MTDTPTTPEGQPALLRHIVPVLAGAIVIAMLTVVTDNWLAARGLLPVGAQPTAVAMLLVTAYRGLFAIIGCHMAARLAPSGQPRIRYALALGGLLMVLNVVGATTNRGLFPTWYALLNVALPLPWAIIGGGTAARVMAGGDRR